MVANALHFKISGYMQIEKTSIDQIIKIGSYQIHKIQGNNHNSHK